jgi:hypothetical protein
MGIVILIVVVLIAGISFGFILGFSRSMHEAASGIHGTRRPTIAWVIICLGCAALLGALGTMLYTWHFTSVAQRASGTVVEMREQTDKDSGSTSYAPTFHFQDASGSPHTVSSSFFSSPQEFHVGDVVTVLYRRDDPQSARIDSYWQVWGLPSLLGIGGCIELPIGLIVLFWPKIIVRFRGQTANAQTV